MPPIPQAAHSCDQNVAIDHGQDARKLRVENPAPIWLDLAILWPRKTTRFTRGLRHQRPYVGRQWEQGMSDVGRRDLKQCPRCGTTMLLEQIMAKFGPLPETRRYRCPECRCVVEEEIDRDGHPLSAIAGLADWLGIGRVVN
jgi:hypothetical protein